VSQAILADIPVNAQPGSQLVYIPMMPVNLDEPGLKGQTIRTISLTLTNENGDYITTLGNDWTITLKVSYRLF